MEGNLIEFIRRDTEKDIAWLYDERNPDFGKSLDILHPQIDETIRIATENFPIANSTTFVERTGSFGYLPPPSKRVWVAASFRGESYVPERVFREEISSAQKEIVVDHATIQLFGYIDETTHCTGRARTLIHSILSMYSFIRDGRYSVTPPNPGGVSIRLEQVQAELLLIKRGILNNFDFLVLPLNNSDDIWEAINICQTQMTDVLRFVPQASIDMPVVATANLTKRVNQEVLARKDRLIVPVLVNSTIGGTSVDPYTGLFLKEGAFYRQPVVYIGNRVNVGVFHQRSRMWCQSVNGDIKGVTNFNFEPVSCQDDIKRIFGDDSLEAEPQEEDPIGLLWEDEEKNEWEK